MIKYVDFLNLTVATAGAMLSYWALNFLPNIIDSFGRAGDASSSYVILVGILFFSFPISMLLACPVYMVLKKFSLVRAEVVIPLSIISGIIILNLLIPSWNDAKHGYLFPSISAAVFSGILLQSKGSE
jgi:hypothetical protein